MSRRNKPIKVKKKGSKPKQQQQLQQFVVDCDCGAVAFDSPDHETWCAANYCMFCQRTLEVCKCVIDGRPQQQRSVYLNPDIDEINLLNEEYGMATQLPMIVKKGKHEGKANVGSANGSGYYHGSYYHGSGSYAAATCTHTGDKIVFEAEGRKLYASSWNGLKEYSGKWDLIIDLAGNVKPPAPPGPWDNFVRDYSTVEWAAELQAFVASVPPKKLGSELLSLKWPDMGIAEGCGLDFWLKLWEKLPEKTVVACMGGHGRTGTCLAAFMIVNGIDYWTAVEMVRADHCSKAIESLSQEQYLHALYMQFLQMRYALLIAAGEAETAEDVAKELKVAQANRPSATSTTATKAVGGAASSVPFQQTSGTSVIDAFAEEDEEEFYLGDPVATKMEGGKTFDRRCTNRQCNKGKCIAPAHLEWVERKQPTTVA